MSRVKSECEEEGTRTRLSLLRNNHLGRPQQPAVEHIPLALHAHHNPVLALGLGHYDGDLVRAGIELGAELGVDLLDAVLGEGLHEDGLGHLEALVEGGEVGLVLGAVAGDGLEGLGGDVAEGAVEVVDGVEEVGGELLDGEGAGGLLVAGAAVLERAELGEEAEVLVLFLGGWLVSCVSVSVSASFCPPPVLYSATGLVGKPVGECERGNEIEE